MNLICSNLLWFVIHHPYIIHSIHLKHHLQHLLKSHCSHLEISVGFPYPGSSLTCTPRPLLVACAFSSISTLGISLQCRRPGFDPWVGKVPWRREWQPTPVFLPRESHGQRSLAGYYSPWGCKELDTTEQLTLSLTPLSLSCDHFSPLPVINLFNSLILVCMYSKNMLDTSYYISGSHLGIKDAKVNKILVSMDLLFSVKLFITLLKYC